MRHSMKPDLRADYKIRLYTGPTNPFFEVSSFNGKLRDELLNGEIFYSLKEAQILIEHWRQHYNPIRPHSSLGYRPPTPKTVLPRPAFAPLHSVPPVREGWATITAKL